MARPSTELSGVRSSWLTPAQNRVLLSLAARSCRVASSSSAYRATTPWLVCSSSSDSSACSANTPRLVSSSSALARTRSSWRAFRSSSAVSRSWFWIRRASSALPAGAARHCLRNASMRSAVNGSVLPRSRRVSTASPLPVRIATSQLSMSRAAAASPSVPSRSTQARVIDHVAVITRRGARPLDTPRATVAGCPMPASSRHSSLNAVATRTWSWLSSPTTAATVRPRCRAANTSASPVMRSRMSSCAADVTTRPCPPARRRRRAGSRRRAAGSRPAAAGHDRRDRGRRPPTTGARTPSECSTTTAPGG